MTTPNTGATGAPPNPPTKPPENPPISSQKERSDKEKNLRLERNAARDELAKVTARLTALEADQKAKDEKLLTEQGEFKKLAETRAAEIETLKKTHADEMATFKKKLNEQLVGSALREQLAARGVTDKKTQDVLLPGLRSAIKAKVTDAFEVEVSDWTALEEPLKVLGIKPPSSDKAADTKTPPTAPPAPTLNPAAALLAQTMPGSQQPQPDADLRSGFIKTAKG